MKCLLLTYEYPPFKGGIAAYLSDLVSQKPADMDVKINIPPKGEHWIMTSLRLLFARERYDIAVISHILPAGYAAWYLRVFRGTPYVAIAHGTDILSAQKNAWKRFMMRCCLKHAKVVVANSRFTAGLLKEEGIGRVEIVPPGIDVKFQQLTTKFQNSTIISVGRLIPRKGFDTLIRALPAVIKEVPDARAKIIGKGEYYEELDRIAHELRVENFVEILTDADDERKKEELGKAAIFALPARKEGSDVEGFGIAVLEASAVGLPVVVGRSGGAPETVVDGVTGLLVMPDDSNALSDALVRLLKNPEEARKMGEEGKKYVTEEYSIDKSAKRFWELLNPIP